MIRQSSLIQASTLWMCSSLCSVDRRIDRLFIDCTYFPALKGFLPTHTSFAESWYMLHASDGFPQGWHPLPTKKERTTARFSSIVQSLCAASIRLTSLLLSMRLNYGVLRSASYSSSHAFESCRALARTYCFHSVISKLPESFSFTLVTFGRTCRTESKPNTHELRASET